MEKRINYLLLFFFTSISNILFAQTNCSLPISWTTNNYNVAVTSSTSALGVDRFSNKNVIIDNDLTNASSWISLGIGTEYVEVQNNSGQFPAGTYAGVVLSETSLASLSTTYKVETFLNNTPTNDVISMQVPINLANATNRNLGLIATKPFNKIRLTVSVIGITTTSVNNFYTITPCTNTISLQCNQDTKISQGNFSAVINYSDNKTSLSGLSVGKMNNLGNIVNSDLDDYGTIDLGISALGTAQVSVRDLNQTYSIGNFAGFEISNNNLLDLSILSGITIKTYLNGTLQEESNSNTLLSNVTALGTNPRSVIGFITTKPFNEVQFSLSTLLSANLVGETRIYNMIVKQYCKGEDPACNIDTKIINPNYPAFVQPLRTGTSGITSASINNRSNLINSNTDDYASLNITASVLGNVSLSVGLVEQVFNAGHFAGFEISNNNLLDLSLLGGITIKTYLNGLLQEESNSNTLLLNVEGLGSNPRSIVGFITTKSFDEIQFNLSSALSVNLIGETRIYNTIVKKYCEGPLIACNESTIINKNEYPVNIGKNTNLEGISIGGVTNLNNILDGNSDTYATINIPVGILSTATIAIEKQLSAINAGTYVSFDIELTSLVNVSALPKFKLKLLKDNVQTEIIEGGNFLLGANIASRIRKTLGFKSTKDFDEIQFIYEQPVGVSLGEVRLYDLTILNPCQKAIDCSVENTIDNTSNHPVVINQFRTGIEGLVCAQCSVTNEMNLITTSETDFTTLNLGIGVAGRAGISILDLANIFPSGTYLGFTIEDVQQIIQADLLETFYIKTYLNGIQQEVANSTSLLDLSLILSIGTGKKNFGFRATKPFNEIRLEVGSLVSAINTIKLYNLKVDASNPTNNDGNLICNNSICVKPGYFNTNEAILNSDTGISSLQKPNSTWPKEIPNGFLVLESKNKGFVISRIPSSSNILDPKEGMIIYDLADNCTKIYNGDNWKCITQSCNE
ncbi:hypothetical protein [Chishuiella sp.]|uniref:hypothetical protein n=1 Tax=Chishuiella sp. TaxID=1969467 RepID=UPI0028AA35C4|nr:hypothetical protein [Chishuiella sp.]